MPPDEDPRQLKKYRKELELLHGDKPIANGHIFKDSKKKRKKKKRKSPLTTTEPEVERVVRSVASRSKAFAPISVESSTTLSEASVQSPVTSTTLANNMHVATGSVLGNVAEGEDEKPTFTVSFFQLADSMTRAHNSGTGRKSSDKGKAKDLSEYPDTIISQSDGTASVAEPSHESDSLKAAQAKIAELTAELQSQKTVRVVPPMHGISTNVDFIVIVPT
jgi:hypothetical protein